MRGHSRSAIFHSLMTTDPQALLEAARAARHRAYAPYSNFQVGAAVLLDSGAVIVGANVENASYGLCCCAERVAMFAARTQHPQARMVAIAVSTGAQAGAAPETRMPCGACRQVMAELLAPDAPVIVDGAGLFTLAEIFPNPFQLHAAP